MQEILRKFSFEGIQGKNITRMTIKNCKIGGYREVLGGDGMDTATLLQRRKRKGWAKWERGNGRTNIKGNTGRLYYETLTYSINPNL